jgi:hypothetical protein
MTFPEFLALINLPFRSTADFMIATALWFVGRGFPPELAFAAGVSVMLGPWWTVMHILQRLQLIRSRKKQGGAQ